MVYCVEDTRLEMRKPGPLSYLEHSGMWSWTGALSALGLSFFLYKLERDGKGWAKSFFQAIWPH